MSSDREKIFEMVAEGIITLDEAKRLLECLSVVGEMQEEAAGQIAREEQARQAEQAEEAGQVVQPQETGTAEPQAAPEAPKAPEAPQPFQANVEGPIPKSLLPQSGKQNQYSSAASWVKGFRISWFSGPVEIRSYSGDVVNITEYSKDELRDEDKMEITEQNGIIRVKWDRHGSMFSLSSLTRLLGRLTLSKQLLVEVPESLMGKLELLECSTVSGRIDCDTVAAELMNLSSTSGAVYGCALTARRLKASSVSGKVQLEDITAGDVNVNATSGSVQAEGFSVKNGDWSSVSGSVRLAGSAEALKVSTVSGSVKADLHTCPQSMNVDTVSGGIHIALPDNEGFTVKYSSVSSRLDTQFPVMGAIGKKSGNATYGNGKALFRLSTVSGGMRLHCQ